MKGVYTAVVTPFDRSGNIDFNSMESILKLQVNAGVSGIIVCGTTGEAATLSIEEKVSLFEFVKSKCEGLDIVAGTGTNNTAETVRHTNAAINAGISKVLIVTPYYNKPSCSGLFRHYSEVAQTGAGIVLYNVPGRTGINVSPGCLEKLAVIENIIAVKEATGDLGRLADYIDAVGTDRFDFLSGDDFTVVPFISMGGKGVISVFTNILPELGVAMVNAALAGEFQKAADIQISINRLNKAMFMEPNPLPVKTSLALMKLCEDNFRAPLDRMEEHNISKLSEVLKDYSLI
jgi:4-hydroxy-tetrahydrodipicolinate synthase